MADASSLATLISLAENQADAAGKQLQALATERHHAEEQLSTLYVYRQDYAERLQHASQTGLAASNYHNFRQFIATLDDAILQQNRVVAQIDRKLEQGRQQWQAEKRRLNSYQALQTRHTKQQRLHENRREQQASDEVSANLYRRARHAH
jgi:flagellar FliJ protein